MNPADAGGYEVQIWKQQPAGFNTGAIVGTAKTARPFNFNPNQWNQYQITVDGDHIVVVLNGETTLDIHDAKFPEGTSAFSINNFQSHPGTSRSVHCPDAFDHALASPAAALRIARSTPTTCRRGRRCALFTGAGRLSRCDQSVRNNSRKRLEG
jgi:hypothetical protein